MASKRVGRRTFLKGAAAGTAVLGFPAVLRAVLLALSRSSLPG